MSGRLLHLTGGTTGRARVVVYDSARWSRSVRIKAKIMRAHGVGPDSRVAICHPFGLWSIGQVHVEGALACGADVFPLGLSALGSEALDHLISARPTHICGGARHLIQIAALAGDRIAAHPPHVAFVTGEPLNAHVRSACSTAWKALVVDVYGMAEFDALGVELPGQKGLRLVDDFEYALRSDDGYSSLVQGGTGVLCLRDSPALPWFETKDMIRVLDDSGGFGFGPSIDLQGRVDNAITLPDGSAISELQVARLIGSMRAMVSAQLQVINTGPTVALRLLYVEDPQLAELTPHEVAERLRAINIDVADSIESGVVAEVSVCSVEDSGAFLTTSRNKVPLIVVVE